jgi:hypothetical protein
MTDEDRNQIAKQMNRAVIQVELAYAFVPNSYTYSALNSLLAVQDDIRRVGRKEAST